MACASDGSGRSWILAGCRCSDLRHRGEGSRGVKHERPYGISNISSAEGMASLSALLGAQGFTAVNAYALMIFCLLYIPCAATIAVIRRETGSLKWTLGSILLQLGIAWICATLFFQAATLIAG